MKRNLKNNVILLGAILTAVGVDRCSAAMIFLPWPIASGGNGHLYGITESAGNWLDAETTAVTLGGHLASITSAAEQSFVENTFLVGPIALKPVWIGLTDQASEVLFLWVTGEPLSFTKWKSGEPNNLGDEDYVAINWEHGRGGPLGTWNDCPLGGTGDFGTNTTGPYFGLIEIVPEPPTVILSGLGDVGFVLRRRRSIEL